MIEYGQNVPGGTERRTQVCIVGSGAAGITLAWHLEDAGIQVILLDGSRDFDNDPSRKYVDKELLYAGQVAGMFPNNEPQFLILPTFQGQSPSERERYFGGTTTHWGGQSRPLDPLAFEARPGFGDGWPIPRSELDPYYKMAAHFLKLENDNFTAEYWADVLGAEVPDIPGFETFMYQFVGPNYLNFAQKEVRGQTLATSRIDVIRNASLLDVEYQGSSVRRLRVASMGSGNPPPVASEFFVKADAYVLAAGAVENARLLLLSNAANSSGAVGVSFMAHPLSSGAIGTSGSYLNRAQTNLLNGFDARTGRQWRNANGVTVAGRLVARADLCKELQIGRMWFRPPGLSGLYFETAPSVTSRITLADTVDPVFGQRQSRATWEFNATDQRTYNRSIDSFGEAIKPLGGQLYYKKPWEDVVNDAVVNGHHIGTTRMSSSPGTGVVNGNLRTHDLDNLYVAGSSVYPTAGISNPTMTIVTLSIRLAAHLRAVMRPGA